MSSSPFFSICIPVWGIEGKGINYIDQSFNILAQQSFKDFEVVISDHSTDDYIQNHLELWREYLDIKYYRCDVGRGSIGPNLNNALSKCSGKYVKFLFQDDFLFNEYSLQIHYEYILNNNPKWVVCGSCHTKDLINIYDVMIPKYNIKIYEGINTISCPSVLTIQNSDSKLYFDESLKWLIDVDYYKRLFDKYGGPDIIRDVCVVNRESEVRATNMIDDSVKKEEYVKMHSKYSSKINLDEITIVSVAGIKADEALNAIKYSCRDINFKSKKLITPENIIDSEVEIIKCNPLNYEQYNHFLVYELYKYIDTEYALIVQGDGYVVNPQSWRSEFLDYDYIGAIWPLPQDNFSFKDDRGIIQRVGNGGFSLRSKKLLEVASKYNIEWKPYHGFYHEDGFICVNNRSIYESAGCKFAPINVASKFSHETDVIENKNIIPFGFHGRNNVYYKKL